MKVVIVRIMQLAILAHAGIINVRNKVQQRGKLAKVATALLMKVATLVYATEASVLWTV